MSLSPVRTSTIGRTTGYYGAMVTFGLLGAAWGPAIPFLASSTGTELARISLIFTALAFGGFLGTTLGGRSYDKVPGHAIMTAALVIMASTAVLIPLATMLWLLLLLIFILGVAAGLMTVGANTLGPNSRFLEQYLLCRNKMGESSCETKLQDWHSSVFFLPC